MLLVVLVAIKSPAEDASVAAIANASKLADQEKYEESNKVLMDLAKTNPANPDIYWMAARNFYDMGERIPIEKDKAKKLQMYVSCEQWARKGYEKNPGLADNAFWVGVGLGQQSQVKGIAATLTSDPGLAKKIENFLIIATQAKEFHYREKNTNTVAAGHLALGMFYRKIPDSIIVKALTGTKGDIDKSVLNLRKAVSIFPNNLEMTKELGVSLLCRSQRKKNPADLDEGKKYLQKVTQMPADGQLDKVDQADAKKLIANPSIACGYSRVQQEDVNEDSFKKK